MTDLNFHPLSVTEVSRLTDDAVAVTMDVPSELADRFGYLPGQHVTMRLFVDGADVRRSYSICAPASCCPSRISRNV